MEKVALKNFQDSVSKTILNKAKKLSARDLEEESPNKIVAYVDEGKESYDVSIELEKDTIINLTCDCDNSATICVHKVALVNSLNSKKSHKVASVKNKRVESDFILDEISKQELQFWVSDLFKKNKDLELLFINEFSKSQYVFDNKSIKDIIEKSIKSVIKGRRSLDATELKRIIEVLDISLKPFIKYCKENIDNPKTNDLLYLVYFEMLEFNYIMDISSVKLIRFIEKIYKEINLYIHNLKDIEQWKLIIKNHTEFVFYRINRYELELEILFHLYDSIDSEERKNYFAIILFDIFTIAINKGTKYTKIVMLFFLKVFSENNFFEKVYLHFLPMRYENDYNRLLIEKLIKIEKFDLAEKIAWQQVESNSNEKYNFPYYDLINNIYAITNDEKKSAFLKMKTIFFEYSLDAYILIQKYSEEADFKKFRTKLLGHYKRNFYNNSNAVIAYLDIYYNESNFKKIIENISSYTPYELIYGYKEELYNFDKYGLLKGLTKIEKGSYFYFERRSVKNEFRTKFVDWIIEKYDKNIIQTFIKSEISHSRSELMKELETAISK